jgi:hypothetical protein
VPHQMADLLWFPVSVQCIFRVFLPFTSYIRCSSAVKNDDLSTSAAKGRDRLEVTSPFGSSTTVF